MAAKDKPYTVYYEHTQIKTMMVHVIASSEKEAKEKAKRGVGSSKRQLGLTTYKYKTTKVQCHK